MRAHTGQISATFFSAWEVTPMLIGKALLWPIWAEFKFKNSPSLVLLPKTSFDCVLNNAHILFYSIFPLCPFYLVYFKETQTFHRRIEIVILDDLFILYGFGGMKWHRWNKGNRYTRTCIDAFPSAALGSASSCTLDFPFYFMISSAYVPFQVSKGQSVAKADIDIAHILLYPKQDSCLVSEIWGNTQHGDHQRHVRGFLTSPSVLLYDPDELPT